MSTSHSDSQKFANSSFQNKGKPTYHKFQLVWAKVPGFSWWPGKVIALPEKNSNVYSIIFSGDGSVAYLKPQYIRPYIYGEQPPVNLKTASIDLKRSIQHFKREFEYGIMRMVEKSEKLRQKKSNDKNAKQNGSRDFTSTNRSSKRQKDLQITYHKQHDELEEEMSMNFSKVKKNLLEQKECEKKKVKANCDWKIDFIQSMVQNGLKRKSASIFLEDLLRDNLNQSEKVQFTASRNQLKQVKTNNPK